MKKYGFTGETKKYDDVILHRIYLLARPHVIGGWIESEKNLSQDGDCWIDDDAIVYGNARVLENASVEDSAIVYDHAVISGNASVSDHAKVHGFACVSQDAYVRGYSDVKGNAVVCERAKVDGWVLISGHAKLKGRCRVSGHSQIIEHATISDSAKVYAFANVCGKSIVCDYATVNGKSIVCGDSIIRGSSTISDSAKINGATIQDYGYVGGNATVNGPACICEFASVDSASIVQSGKWEYSPPSISIGDFAFNQASPNEIAINGDVHTIDEWRKIVEDLFINSNRSNIDIEKYTKALEFLIGIMEETATMNNNRDGLMRSIDRIFEISEKDQKTVIEKGLKLSEETGELARALLVMSQAHGTSYRRDPSSDRANVIEEIADVITVAFSIIQRMGASRDELSTMLEKKLDKWESVLG